MACSNCGKDVPRGSRMCLVCANKSLGFGFNETVSSENTSGVGPETNYELASISRRSLAIIIDGFVLTLFSILTFLVILVLNVKFVEGRELLPQIENFLKYTYKREEGKIQFQIYLIFYALFIPYIGVMFHFFGATLGKICLGITIIKQSSQEHLGFLGGIYRELICRYALSYIFIFVSYLSSVLLNNILWSALLIFIFQIGITIASIVQYALPFLNQHKKTLHDYLAGTIVIKNIPNQLND